MTQDRYERKARKGAIYYEDKEGNMISKVCTKCEMDVILEGYRKKEGGLGGKASICRACESKRGRKWREENPDKIREMAQKYYEEKRDEIREKQRKYHEEKPHMALNRNRKWRKQNCEMLRERMRLQRQANPEKNKVIIHRRLARKRHLPDTLSHEQMNEILDHFGGCALSGGSNVHFDHVIPLATGHGGTTYGNMVPLRADLNLTKNDSNVFEWFEANRQRLNLSQEKFDSLIDWLAKANEVSVEDYRDYVYWCHDNPHSLEDLQSNDEGEAI